MWMKWHHTFAEGSDGDEWYDLGDCTLEKAKIEAKEVCIELRTIFEYSDHYRGIEYEIVELPPPDVLERIIKENEDRISRLMARVIKLKKLLPPR